MLALLSPAKSLDVTSDLPTRKHSTARMLDQSQLLIDELLKLSVEDIAELMSISDDLAELNYERYRDFELPLTRKNARPALLMFNGDAYQAMAAGKRFDERDFTEASKTLRILSGLYGLLRPLDLIAPYRLEMGSRLATDRGVNLYEFWGDRLTEQVAADLAESPGADVVVNLASDEYSSAVDFDELDARVITPRFEDRDRSGNWRVISFSAKRARGEMAAWLIQNRARTAKVITDFDAAGYHYDRDASSPDTPVFRREKAAGA